MINEQLSQTSAIHIVRAISTILLVLYKKQRTHMKQGRGGEGEGAGSVICGLVFVVALACQMAQDRCTAVFSKK